MEQNPVIADSARKHGVADEDMLHAYRHAVRYFDLDEGFTMIVGGAITGELVEVGVVVRDRLACIVHAMSAREQFR